jgi:hypothetical protein
MTGCLLAAAMAEHTRWSKEKGAGAMELQPMSTEGCSCCTADSRSGQSGPAQRMSAGTGQVRSGQVRREGACSTAAQQHSSTAAQQHSSRDMLAHGERQARM